MILIFLLRLLPLLVHGHEEDGKPGILEYLNPQEWLHETWVTKYEPKTSTTCKALLPWTCQCDPLVINELDRQNASKVKTVSCINSRISDYHFLKSFTNFPNIQSLTVHGNDLRTIPERCLGNVQHKHLLYLNFTSNNLSCLHHDSLVGLPSLQSLDLSLNRIKLRVQTGDWGFLRPARFLRRLLLRRAFQRPVKKDTSQLDLLEIGLRHAHLIDLQFLDLSENEIHEFPSRLLCWTPSLTHLILAHNRLRDFRIDDRCSIKNLIVVDLQSNLITAFSPSTFIKTASRLPPVSVQVVNNPLQCTGKTCSTWHTIVWFRRTDVIKDKEEVRCYDVKDQYLLYAKVDSTVKCKDGYSEAQSAVKDVKETPGTVEEGENRNGNGQTEDGKGREGDFSEEIENEEMDEEGFEDSGANRVQYALMSTNFIFYVLPLVATASNVFPCLSLRAGS